MAKYLFWIIYSHFFFFVTDFKDKGLFAYRFNFTQNGSKYPWAAVSMRDFLIIAN